MKPRTEINVYAFGQDGQCVQTDEGTWLVRYKQHGRLTRWVPYAGIGQPPEQSRLPVLVLRRRAAA